MDRRLTSIRSLVKRNKSRLNAAGFIALLIMPVLLYEAAANQAPDMVISLLLGLLALIMFFFAVI